MNFYSEVKLRFIKKNNLSSLVFSSSNAPHVIDDLPSALNLNPKMVSDLVSDRITKNLGEVANIYSEQNYVDILNDNDDNENINKNVQKNNGPYFNITPVQTEESRNEHIRFVTKPFEDVPSVEMFYCSICV